jgi:ADP-ribose pyrophosphatase YjhB (NUDIX family)
MIRKAAAIIIQNNKLLVVSEDGETYQSPGGVYEGDETPLQCLIRELRQELCLESISAEPLGYIMKQLAAKSLCVWRHILWNMKVHLSLLMR